MEKNALDINLKTNTQLLIDYLEAVIADEMILNSFIRGIEIINEQNNTITIATNSAEGFTVIKEHYFQNVLDAVKNVYQKDYEVKLVITNTNIANEQNNEKSKYISTKFKFDNYVEGDFNRESIKMIQKTIEKPGKYSPLFIYSSSGLGKTHLLHAAGNAFTRNDLSVRYIEPNSFTKTITDLSKAGGTAISEYIDSLLKYDVLLFDDVQNLGDRVVTLRVLFQIFNTFIENNKQIIFTSDKSPKELSGFEDRFITRFSSGLTTHIENPSSKDLIKVLEFKLKEQNLSPEKWEREAIKFIVRNNSNSIRSIEGAVKRVSFYTEDENDIKYTYTVISNIFKELEIDPNELTPKRIIASVGAYYKMPVSEITGKSRKADVMLARHMAIWMIRRILELPLKDIGKLFGKRDHTTILASIKKTDNKMAINKIVKVAAEKIERNIKSNV